MSNPFETAARLRKAYALADVVRRASAALGKVERPATIAAQMTDAEWHLAARIAGFRDPSARTRRQVERILRTEAA